MEEYTLKVKIKNKKRTSTFVLGFVFSPPHFIFAVNPLESAGAPDRVADFGT